ncbi:MAG: patatin-like phospholipase family protein, partial [Alphaproteobacteria bacterium]|nr:patatin-like phospholipase family protein [Alphaproteobacteria bacterium]
MTVEFPEIAKKERDCIAQRLNLETPPDEMRGLALSGGGIRSAAFAMGVLQSLEGKCLDGFHYLSTVSGGGFTGGALTWFRSKKLPFPFGVRGQGSRCDTVEPATKLLNHIRQRGNYLDPGHGLTMAALLAVTLRTMLLTAATYLGLAALAFLALLELGWLSSAPGSPLNDLMRFGGLALALFAVGAALYSLATLGLRPTKASSSWRYALRRRSQQASGVALTAAVVALVIGAIPIVVAGVAARIDPLFFRDPAERAMLIGGALFLASPLAVWMLYDKARKGAALDLPGSALAVLGASGAVLGLLFLSYGMALRMHEGFGWLAAGAIFAVALGLLRNINHFSLHRMYRDRLMEAFTPDLPVKPEGAWGPADRADQGWLADLAPCPSGGCKVCKPPSGPYHLINANVVLPNSKDIRYRGRAGDNFLLSPLACGSDATGRVWTVDFATGGEGVSLPSAIAISGAAVNAHTGGASSPTRSGALGLLMAMFGLQLGVWVANPRHKMVSRAWPNDLYPGLGGVVGVGMDENAWMVMLSDGGHFENLGLYELFRRKLDLIVVSDAGCDPKFSFADLGNAIEKARVDFGIQVKFAKATPLADLVSDASTMARRGFAVATILYPNQRPGRLVYLKPTLTNDLPADLYAYRAANAAFPHQSTADQFFDEAQFEAYRELGYQLGKAVAKELPCEADRHTAPAKPT